MRIHGRLASLVLASTLAAAALPAQFGVQLAGPSGSPTGTGGSVPGSLRYDLGPGAVGAACVILLSINSGPTPLFLVDPIDPRSLNLGAESLATNFPGIYLPPNNLHSTPTLPIVNPTFIGVPLFFQGIDFPGTGNPGNLVNNISNPVVTRFTAANSFRASAGNMSLRRSFAEILENADGTITAAGGGQGPVLAQLASDTTERYDPLTDTWSAGPSIMTSARTLYRVVKLDDGRYLLTGGLGPTQGAIDTAETYDPVTEQFTAVASMSTRRAAYRRIKLADGRILVMGGFTHVSPVVGIAGILTSSTNTTEIFDPTTDTWSAGPSMLVPRATFEVEEIGPGKWLVMGGVGPFNFPPVGIIPLVFQQCEVYDESTNTFSPAANMVSPRAAFGIVKLPNGNLLANGGGDVINQTYPAGRVTTSAEIYDVVAGTWALTGSLTTDRAFHLTFPIENGKVLSIGGANGDLVQLNPVQSTEIFDPATGTWSAGPALPQPTNGYGPWDSPQGELWIVGGATTGATALDSVAVYYR